jgi:hypothetical protein
MGTTGCSTARDCLPGCLWASFAVIRPRRLPTIDLMTRILALGLLLGSLALSSAAAALTPRIAVCGRVTSFDATVPGGPLVRLGTQEPRHLVTGGIPQLGSEVCIWGVAVENVNPPIPDPTPKGIAAYSIAPVTSLACAAVTGTIATFVMPGEDSSPLPNAATLILALSAPAPDGCVRIAIDAQGNPLAVVIPHAGTAPVVASPSTPVKSLPNTSTSHGP